MTDEPRHQPGVPAFRFVGPGSLVTKSCMGCGKNKLTGGSTGQGIRWRCAACSSERLAQRGAS
jgi:hypothetical protein